MFVFFQCIIILPCKGEYMSINNRYYLSCLTLIIFFWTALPLFAQETPDLAQQQEIYVPAYSHIYIGNNERPFLLTVTLSIRNIDPKKSMKVVTVDYYETQGKLLKSFLTAPVTLGPLESVRYIIPEKEKIGGSGANFIVQWQADSLINAPIVESIMIGASSGQGISFTSRGKVIAATE
jgi:hypothetical protein